MKANHLCFLSFYLFALLVSSFAEGTYELNGKSGSNPNIYLESAPFGVSPQVNLNLGRDTELYVDILNFNEVIDIYTSVYHGSVRDIAIWGPGKDWTADTPDAIYNVTQNGVGHIDSWTDVVNAQSLSSRVKIPITFTASTTGIYTIKLYGSGANSRPAGNDAGGVQFFDIVVRDTKGTGGTIDDILRKGRLWTDHFALSSLSFDNEYTAELFMVDGEDMNTFYEGYLWKGSMNDIEPFGFHMFVNRNGAYPSQFHSTSTSSVSALMVPEFPMYLNYPEKPVIRPVIPTVTDLVFRATCNLGNPGGGTFEFNTNGSWTFEIVIDENGDDIYDRGTEKVISGPATPGFNAIPWDGTLFDGSAAPNGLTVKVVLRAKASEIHFPFYDVENNNYLAGPEFNLLPFDTPVSSNYYWDDRPVGGTSNLAGSPAPHVWGQSAGYGDGDIIDTWKVAFEDIKEYVLSYNCNDANLIMYKRVDNNRPAEQDQIEFEVEVLNAGPNEATVVEITDALPAGLTYVSHTTNTGNFVPGTGVWTVGTMPVGQRDTLFITASVDVGTNNTVITNTATVTNLGEADADPSNNTASVDVSVGRFSISGYVFEDIQYGGGAGRPRSATGTATIQGATVELYNQSTGAYISNVVSNFLGYYEFTDLLAGTYVVRVVNSTITSQRVGGSDPGTIPVQTYTTQTSSNTLQGVTNRVGGETPTLEDAGPNGGSTNFSSLPSAGEAVQSIATIELINQSFGNVDFGFNYNTIVNTNDDGQGSLRQAIANTNILSNGGLDQDGLTAGVDHTIFSIPASDPNWDGNTYTINLVTALPDITDSFTAIDGSTQSLLTGNTNPAVTGVSTGPEIIINGTAAAIIEILAGYTTVRSIGLEQSTGAAEEGAGIYIPNSGAVGSIVEDVTIQQNAGAGIYLGATASNITIQNSVITGNGVTQTDRGGIYATGASSIIISNNFLTSNRGEGISLFGGSSSITIQSNTITSNGFGGAGYSAGIGLHNASDNTISQNTLESNTGDGITGVSGTGNRITQNSFLSNGGLGIDLGVGTQGDGVTINDSGDGDAGANDLLNFPIIESLTMVGGDLVVEGFARPGVELEFYLTDGDPTGFGEGRTYLFSVTEGSVDDNDATVDTYVSPINGLTVGTDNTNRFSFTVPNPGGVQITREVSALAIDGSNNTSEFSGRVVVEKANPKITGYVYEDVNTSTIKDASEAGTGLTIYAKLVQGGVGIAVTAVNTTTGFYEFLDVNANTYSIVFDDNNSLADVTPTRPSGWISTEASGYQVTNITTTINDVFNVNAGLYHGSRIEGRVVADNGIGGGVANDGLVNGGELGIEGVTVSALENNGSTQISTALTRGDGTFVLYVPHTYAGQNVIIQETNIALYTVSTGGNAGTTAGTYDRPTDRTTFNFSSGQFYQNLLFMNVGTNAFVGDNVRETQKGTVVFIPHTYTSRSVGEVTFTVSETPSPNVPGWSTVLYHDANANLAFDPGETIVSGAVGLTLNQDYALLLKVVVPAGAAIGNQNAITITADFDYTNSAPLIERALVVDDIVRVNEANSAGLLLVKEVDQATALPGAQLVYTITYTNNGTDPISTVVINDKTPPYTTFVSAGFGALPDAFTNCVIADPGVGVNGSITWTFTGVLNSGSSGTVTYTVLIDN